MLLPQEPSQVRGKLNASSKVDFVRSSADTRVDLRSTLFTPTVCSGNRGTRASMISSAQEMRFQGGNCPLSMFSSEILCLNPIPVMESMNRKARTIAGMSMHRRSRQPQQSHQRRRTQQAAETPERNGPITSLIGHLKMGSKAIVKKNRSSLRFVVNSTRCFRPYFRRDSCVLTHTICIPPSESISLGLPRPRRQA